MEKRSQGAVEYLLMLGAVFVVVASIVACIHVVSTGLGSSVSNQIDNTLENAVIPSLVGVILLRPISKEK